MEAAFVLAFRCINSNWRGRGSLEVPEKNALPRTDGNGASIRTENQILCHNIGCLQHPHKSYLSRPLKLGATSILAWNWVLGVREMLGKLSNPVRLRDDCSL